MSCSFRPLLSSLVLIIAGVVTGDATTLYNNGAPNQSDGTDISEFIAADDFVLTTGATITGATFWSSADLDPFPSQFSGSVGWGIFSNSGGAPGTLLASGVNNAPVLQDTGIQILGTEEWKITFAIPSLSLSSGTYWLGLHESAFSTPDDGTTIYWDTTSSQTGAVAMATSDLTASGGWFQAFPGTGSDLAFYLTGDATNSGSTTPEPPSVLPASLICGGLLLFGRRLAAVRR